MTITALHTTRELAEEGHALNAAQHRVLLNLDTPEIDSVVEEVAQLAADFDIPRPRLLRIMNHLAKVIELNTREGSVHYDVAGEMTRALRASGAHHCGRSLTIQSAARKLREPLKLLTSPAVADPLAFMHAVRAVDEVVASCTEAQLRSHTLAKELGRPPYRLHAVLLSLLGDEAGEAVA